MPEALTNSAKLVIERTIAASPERVFAAWTEPEQMRRWMAPGDMTAPKVESEAKAGGSYRITMRAADGEEMVVRGTFLEVVPPSRLAYTWSWVEDAPADEVETLVTVEFRERAGKTDVFLTQERFVSDESRDRHVGGWTTAIDQLATYLG